MIFLLGCLLIIGQLEAQTISKRSIVQEITTEACDKKVVVLGELPSHGEAIGFQIKAEIVKDLVEKCNFNGLFFEAPIYDFIGFQKAIINKNANPSQLDNAIGGFWMTNELRQWRQWLFTHSIAGKLFIGGLDDQISRSSNYAKTVLPKLVANSIDSKIMKGCDQAIERNLFWHYNEEHKFNESEKKLLYQCAQLAFENQKETLKTSQKNDALKMLENLTNLYARSLKNTNAMNRDEIMYRNFIWHYERLHKTSKTIIWTATVHAARQQGQIKNKPLGSWLSELFQNKLQVIGFTAFNGHSSMAGMPVRPIADAADNALEAMVNQSNLNWMYLNSSALKEVGFILSRIHGKFTSADWSKYYDGIVIIKQESAPTFVKNN